MEGSSLAAIELLLFLGLAGWLLYYQFVSSRRKPGEQKQEKREDSDQSNDTTNG